MSRKHLLEAEKRIRVTDAFPKTKGEKNLLLLPVGSLCTLLPKMWEIFGAAVSCLSRKKKEGNGRFKANSDFSPATHTKLGWKECGWKRGELTSGQNQQLHSGRKRKFVLSVSFCKLPISGQISFSSKPIHFRLSGRRFFFPGQMGKEEVGLFLPT